MATIGELLRANASRFPGHEALVFGDRSATWSQLDARVDSAAAQLAQQGLRHGERCGLMAGNSDDYVIAVCAILRLGAILVPVNTRLAAPEIEHILADSGCRLLLHDTTVRKKAEGAAQRKATIAVPVGEVLGAPISVHRDFGEDVRESDDAIILYTSGTTGRPKGVLLDHHREIWAGLAQLHMGSLSEKDRYLHVAPLYHGAGMTLITAMLLAGGTQVVLEKFEPEEALQLIETKSITVLLGVPTMYQLMLEHRDLPKRDLSAWRIGFFGAAPMPAATVEHLLRALPEIQLIQQAGQTEAGPAGIYATAEQVRARPDATGRQAFPYMEARVVDDHARDVQSGSVGELVLRGESVMKRYWGLPEETAETVRNGWLHTGDLVRLDPDGYLTIVDRIKDLIITGGRNVYSVEVENALASHPAIADCAVVGRPHKQYGETIVAVVTPRAGTNPTLEEIRAHCAKLIADYKAPRDLVLAEIPRNASGKILKRELREAIGRLEEA